MEGCHLRRHQRQIAAAMSSKHVDLCPRRPLPTRVLAAGINERVISVAELDAQWQWVAVARPGILETLAGGSRDGSNNLQLKAGARKLNWARPPAGRLLLHPETSPTRACWRPEA